MTGKNGRKLEDLEVLAEFQHYGAATFLMDFTYNTLVALWFACKEGSNGNSKDGKVVAVNPNDPKFIQGTQEFKIITLDLLEKKIDEFSLDNRKLYQWQPRQQQNERIIAQQSIFLFGVLEIEINPDEECIIDGSCKEDIRESLKRIYGITPDMLFPDFDGFARHTVRKSRTPVMLNTTNAPIRYTGEVNMRKLLLIIIWQFAWSLITQKPITNATCEVSAGAT